MSTSEEVIFNLFSSTSFVVIFVLVRQVIDSFCRLPSGFALDFHSLLRLGFCLHRSFPKQKLDRVALAQRTLNFYSLGLNRLGRAHREEHSYGRSGPLGIETAMQPCRT